MRSLPLMQRLAGTAVRPREERPVEASRAVALAPPRAAHPPAREAAAVLVAIALVGLGLPIWWTAQSGWGAVKALARPGPTATERDLGAPAGGFLNGALLAAARAIPRDATFSVRVGFDPPIDAAYTDAATGLFRYWLLPRRFTEEAHAADWIVTFHHPASTLGVTIAKVVPLAPYTNAVEVKH